VAGIAAAAERSAAGEVVGKPVAHTLWADTGPKMALQSHTTQNILVIEAMQSPTMIEDAAMNPATKSLMAKDRPRS